VPGLAQVSAAGRALQANGPAGDNHGDTQADTPCNHRHRAPWHLPSGHMDRPREPG